MRLNAKLRSILVPLAKAYHYNFTKLRLIFEKLKKKNDLDTRIDIMEKQLKIWHERYGSSKSSKSLTPTEKERLEKKMAKWEEQIADLNAEEEDIQKEIGEEDELLSRASIFDKILTSVQLWFLYSSDIVEFENSLNLLLMIEANNRKVMKQNSEINLYDYITDNIGNSYNSVKELLYYYKRGANMDMQTLGNDLLVHKNKSKTKALLGV